MFLRRSVLGPLPEGLCSSCSAYKRSHARRFHCNSLSQSFLWSPGVVIVIANRNFRLLRKLRIIKTKNKLLVHILAVPSRRQTVSIELRLSSYRHGPCLAKYVLFWNHLHWHQGDLRVSEGRKRAWSFTLTTVWDRGASKPSTKSRPP